MRSIRRHLGGMSIRALRPILPVSGLFLIPKINSDMALPRP